MRRLSGGNKQARKRPEDRGEQALRLLRIMRDLLQLGGAEIPELAERYTVDTRTIRRDLKVIEHMLPLESEESGESARKRWSVKNRDLLGKVADLIDITHYVSLRMTMDGVLGRESYLFAALSDLADKIEKVLGKSDRDHLKRIGSAFYSYEKFAYQNTPKDVLVPIIEAIGRKQYCSVTYRAPRVVPADKTIEILPLKVFFHDGAIYCLAYGSKHQDSMLLNLQRLVRLQPLKKFGDPPKAIRPQEWENIAFGVYAGKPIETYRLRFTPEVAPFIRERRWHSTQQLRDLRDGRVELTFNCGRSPELWSWVAKWRDQVEVIEPAPLREELRNVGEWMAHAYSRHVKIAAGG